MPGIDHTTYILYRYLKELSVKISYGSIRQSLDPLWEIPCGE